MPSSTLPNSLLFSLLFDSVKQSYSILNLVFMSEMQSKKSDIANKCSTMCVCRIVLQNFYIKIQKSNYNIDISNISHLYFDVMCFSLEKWRWRHSSKRNNDRYVSQNNLRKKRCKCFEIVLGSEGKRQGKKYRNIIRCILNW